MTNASCADCGRIVAFRTHDPSEIAECRNCGTWVKRSAEMPGVAVSVKQSGPVARKTAIPPRKDEVNDSTPNPNINTQRSATKRSAERPEIPSTSSSSGENLTAAAVYAAIRDLQKSVHDLRAGQKRIQAAQEAFKNSQQGQKDAQKALHDGQKALHSGQKQLFGQYQELQQGQQILLDRTLAVTEMPAPKEQSQISTTATPLGPLSSFDESIPPEDGFFTTPFSSLKIPLIPIRLEDLGVEPQFTEEGTAPTIPAEDRSDRESLIDGPLPEPPPYVEPEVVEEPVAEEPVVEVAPPAPSPFAEATFDDLAFEKAEEATIPEPVEATPQPEAPSEEADPFLSTAAHESPFTIEAAPDEPFSIAVDETPREEQAEGNPFAITPQPFGAKEFTHEPCELDDPFAEKNEDPATTTPTKDDSSTEAPAANALPENGEQTQSEKSLSQQIAAAKEQQESPFDPSQRDLLSDPEKSGILPILGIIITILAVIGACLFFFTDIFKPAEAQIIPPLVEFPARGIPLPEDDERVAEAEEVAIKFLQAKSKEEVEKVIQAVDPSLLTDFWEPITAPTIERLFQGRILENDRIEVDFLINDAIKGKERILPLVKLGEGPFLVNWKNFAECEDSTLLGLAQGILILDNKEELEEGAIRSWVQDGKELQGNLDLGNFQGFKLHNFTEEVVALGVVRKDSPEFKALTEAFASTEIKHKGKPAIRAVLKVKLIEEENLKAKRPARLEVLKVISITWTEEAEGDDIIKEELPAVSTEESPEPKAEQEAKEEATPEDEQTQEAAEEPAQDELPAVPSEDTPLARHPGESPVIRVTID